MNSETEELKEFLFPLNSKIIKEFSQLKDQEQLEVIKIGMDALKTCVEKYKYFKNGEKDDYIENLKIKHIHEVNKLSNEITNLKDVCRNNELQKKKEIQQITDDIVEKQKLLHKYELEQSRDKISKLEEKNKILIDEKIENQQKYYNKILEEKAIAKKEADLLRSEFDEKSLDKDRKIAELQDMLNLNKSSVKKGGIGEDWVYSTLIKYFSTYEITDLHAIGHKGDFLIKGDELTCMIESKNYSKNVAKREITKFYRDIESNDEYNCAILISLQAGVCNKPDFCFEFKNGKPIIFLHKVAENPNNIKIAVDIFKLVLKNMDCFDIAKEETQILLKDKIKDIVSTHKKSVSYLNDYTKLMNETFDLQWNQLNSFFELLNLDK